MDRRWISTLKQSTLVVGQGMPVARFRRRHDALRARSRAPGDDDSGGNNSRGLRQPKTSFSQIKRACIFSYIGYTRDGTGARKPFNKP